MDPVPSLYPSVRSPTGEAVGSVKRMRAQPGASKELSETTRADNERQIRALDRAGTQRGRGSRA
jgi:hypothetical protein